MDEHAKIDKRIKSKKDKRGRYEYKRKNGE